MSLELQPLMTGAEQEQHEDTTVRDNTTSQRDMPKVDVESYAKSLKKVVTDVELPVPITMGIMGRAVSGKRTLLENFVVKLNGEACGVTCPNIASSFDPKEFNWMTNVCSFRVPFFKYMLLLAITFIVTNLSIFSGMLVAFQVVDASFDEWLLSVFQPSTPPISTFELNITRLFWSVNGTNMTEFSIIPDVPRTKLVSVAAPCLIALVIVAVLLLISMIICVTSIIRDPSSEPFSSTRRHFQIVLLMLLCKTPSVRLSSTEPVDIIPVYFNAWVYAGTDNLWACIVEQLFNRTEEMFGYWKTRLYRQSDHKLSHEHRHGNIEAGAKGSSNSQDDCHKSQPYRSLDSDEKTRKVSDDSSVVSSIEKKVPDRVEVNSSKWHNMIPYYAVTILVLTAILTSASLLVIVTIYVQSHHAEEFYAHVLQSISGGVLGVTILTQSKTVFTFLKNLLVSQSGRIRRLFQQNKRSHLIAESLGFMHKVKSEIKITMGFIKVMEQYYGRRFRILIMIEDLDRCKDDKIRDIFEALKLLLSDDGDPIVSIVNIDPAPISKALSEGGKNGRVELENLVNLRFCMPEVTAQDIATAFKNKTERQTHNLDSTRDRTAGVLHQNHSSCDQTVTQPSSSSCLDGYDVTIAIESCLTMTTFPESRSEDCDNFWSQFFKKDGANQALILNPFRLKMTLLATKEVEENTDLLDNSYKALSYLYYTIRMSVACWTAQLKKLGVKPLLTPTQEDSARTLRQRAYVTCTELAQWLLITDRWPYRASWLLYSVEGRQSVRKVTDTKSTMLDHYKLIKLSLYELPDWKSYIELDGGEREFVTALNRFNTLTPQLVIKLMPYTVNLDRGIKQAISCFLESSEQQSKRRDALSETRT